jgi:signal peptidase
MMRLFLRIMNAVVTAALLMAIGLAGFLAFALKRSTDAIPTVMGHKVLSVVSGSMEPAIMTGDVIVVKPLGPGQAVQEGDVITYRTRENANMLITHRVVGAILVNGQPAAYVTKGDANPDQDLSTIALDQVVGRYSWRIPYFGYISNFMRRPGGIILLVVLPGLYLMGVEFRKLWLALSEAEAEKAKALLKGGEQESE